MSELTCKFCGEPFENKGKLLSHYRDGCPKEADGPIPEPPKPAVIPFSALPPEVKVLAKGHPFGLRVIGRLTDEGVEIDEADLLR